MPAFTVDFESTTGPQRRRFTIDQRQPLDAQLSAIIGELRAEGLHLLGAPSDELEVRWNDEPLDLGATPDALGLTPARPLVLRMRARAPERVDHPPGPVEASREVDPHLLFRPPLEGALGGLAAWSIAGVRLMDYRVPVTSAFLLDIAVSALVACGIASGLAIGMRVRRQIGNGALVRTVLLAPLAASLVAFPLLLPAPAAPGRFLALRLLAWILLALAVALIVAAPRHDLARPRWTGAMAAGAVGGVLAGLVYSLPAPSTVTNALAVVLAGSIVGLGTLSWPAWRNAMPSPAA